jgi:hypothetical protein
MGSLDVASFLQFQNNIGLILGEGGVDRSYRDSHETKATDQRCWQNGVNSLHDTIWLHIEDKFALD